MIRSFKLPNGKELHTPKILLTYTNVEHGMGVKPWEYMKVPGLLFPLNFLYPLFEDGTIRQTLKEFLNLQEETITLLDCDLRYTPHKKRFYTINIDAKLKSLLTGPKLEKIDVEKLKETIFTLKPDMFSIPYYSIKFTDSDSEVRNTNDANMRLLEEFISIFDEIKEFCPIPVIQVGIREKIEDKVNEILDLLGEAGLEEHLFFAYGSHVGYPDRPKKETRHDLLNIRRIREILGDDRYLHGFGIGSYTLVPACIYLGVSSVDSTLWSIKAGMKEIIVPGVAARSLRGSKGRQFLSKEESTITCDCPICNGRKISDVKSTYLDDEKKGRIHNAWVQIKDVEMLTEAIKQKKLFAICKERIERDPKKKSLLEVLQHVHTKLVSLC